MQQEGRLLAEAHLHAVTDKNLPVLHNNGGFTNFRPKHMTINQQFPPMPSRLSMADGHEMLS
jgi:hypothetical protein